MQLFPMEECVYFILEHIEQFLGIPSTLPDNKNKNDFHVLYPFNHDGPLQSH